MKSDNKPLSRKIINWSTLVLGITMLMFCTITLIVVESRLNIEEDEHLRMEANFIIKSISVELGKLHLDSSIQWEEEHHMEKEEDPINILIFNKDKSLYYATEGMEDVSFADDYLSENNKVNSAFSIINITNDKVRFIVDPIILKNNVYGWLVTSMKVEGLNHTTKMLLLIYLVAFPFSLLITFIGSSITAQKAVTPIQNISDAARDIQSKNPNKRLPVSQTNDEISHLAITLNSLLDKVEENINNMKQFSQNASHELKSPLVLITSELEQLRSKVNDRSLANGFYHIQNEVERMANIIDSLLNLMKIDSKQISIKKEDVWLNDLVFDEIERYKQRAKERGVSIVADPIDSISIDGDAYWLSIMFSNLIDNALKYSPSDSEIRIRLSGEKNKDETFIEIVDSGPGVKPENLGLLTKRFFRQKDSKPKRGSGIGLSIVDWVVNEHNGELSFSNAENGGLRVKIILPV